MHLLEGQPHVTGPPTTASSIASHRIEMFGRLKDWRRIHTRYDRCALATTSASRRLGTSICMR